MTENRMAELRRLQLTLSGVSIRRLLEIGIEWQEATGKLLKAWRSSRTRKGDGRS